jgi:hypothetical protein
LLMQQMSGEREENRDFLSSLFEFTVRNISTSYTYLYRNPTTQLISPRVSRRT